MIITKVSPFSVGKLESFNNSVVCKGIMFKFIFSKQVEDED